MTDEDFLAIAERHPHIIQLLDSLRATDAGREVLDALISRAVDKTIHELVRRGLLMRATAPEVARMARYKTAAPIPGDIIVKAGASDAPACEHGNRHYCGWCGVVK